MGDTACDDEVPLVGVAEMLAKTVFDFGDLSGHQFAESGCLGKIVGASEDID